MQNVSIIEKIQNQLKSKKALTLSPMGLALAACGGGETSDQPNSQGPNNSQSANFTTKGSLQPTTSDLWDRTLEVYGLCQRGGKMHLVDGAWLAANID